MTLRYKGWNGEFCSSSEANATTYLLPMLRPYIRLGIRTEKLMIISHLLQIRGLQRKQTSRYCESNLRMNYCSYLRVDL